MKWKFSKVTALLLAGAMVVTSGCTDYKDDIQDLNKRLDDLNAETVANFETQKTAMETLQKELEKADDDIQKNIDNIESDIKKLQDADATLKKAMEDADAALKKELEAADAALKKAMEDADKQLKQAMESGDAATLAAAKADAKANLDAAKAELQKQIEGVQSNLDSEIKKVNEIIATLATKEELAGVKTEMQEKLEYAVAVLNQRIDKEVKTLNSTIETAVEELKAMIAALDAKKLDKQVFEDYKTEVARHFAEIENSIAVLETKLTAQIARVEADLKGRIAALEGRMADAEAALRKIEGEIIPGINAHIETLYEQISKNANDLAAYKALTDQTLAYLMEAVTSLQNGLATGLDSVNGRVDSLDNKLEQYYSNIQAALNDRVLTAVFEQYKQDVEWKLKEMKADYESQIAATKDALEKKIAACEQLAIELNAAMMQNLNGQVANLKQAIAESEARSKQEIAAVKSELEQKLSALENRVSAIEAEIAKMQTAISELESGLAKAIEEINHITEEGGVLATAIDGVIKKHDIEVAEINERIKTLSGRVDQLEIDVDDLLSRIQSIVYVPDYNDGKITIEYALLNGKVVEGQSKITYKVLPASETNTTLLAQAWKADNSILDFASHEVAIRAAGNEMFQIKDVEANGDLLTLTVATRGLGDDFYGVNDENIATDSYSIALLVNYKNNVRSSEYANCIAGSPKTMKMVILNGEQDVTNNLEVENYQVSYVNIGQKPGEILPNHKVAFKLGGKTYDLAEITEAGYKIDVESAVKFEAAEGNRAEQFDNKVLDETVVDKIANVTLAGPEPVAEAVGDKETVTYSYTACGLTVETAASVEIVPIQAVLELKEIPIFWNYLLDAGVDAAHYDDNTVPELYMREGLSTELDVEKSDFAGDETLTLEHIIENGVLDTEKSKVTVDNVKVDTPVVDFVLVDGKAVVNVTDFEFVEKGKTYAIDYVYNLSNVTAHVKLSITTTDRSDKAVELEFNTVENPYLYPYSINLVIPYGEIADRLDGVFDQIQEHQDFEVVTDMTGVEFLEDIFATHALKNIVNTVGSQNPVEGWATNMNIAKNEEGVWTATCGYSYKTFSTFENPLTYTKEFCTWYGQKVVVKNTIKFTLPQYNFKYSTYVYDNGLTQSPIKPMYYSLVNPAYRNESGEAIEINSSELFEFNTHTVDMNLSFNVVRFNGEGFDYKKDPNPTEAYTFIEDLEAEGLVREFAFKEAPKHEGITIDNNIISYLGTDDSVPVKGTLYMVNDNQSKVEIPTAFYDGGAYADYRVYKFDPIKKVQEDPFTTTEYIDNAKMYSVNILDYIKMQDVRGFELIADGAFVTGNGVDNGFADGRNVVDVYGLEIDYEATMATIPIEFRPFIKFNKETTTIEFNYNGELALARPINVSVKIKIDYIWGHQEAEFICTFQKK